MNQKFEISWETADDIALQSLVAHMHLIQKELENPKIHPEDLKYNKKVLKAIKKLIYHYSGEEYAYYKQQTP